MSVSNSLIFAHLHSEKHLSETASLIGKMSKSEFLKVKFMFHTDLCAYT